MSQHDYNIANQTFPATRADINNALAAMISLNSGSTAPTTTYAYMPWMDTSGSPSVLKQRNSANTNWLVMHKSGKTGFIPQDGSTIYAADAGSTDTYVVTLDPVPTALNNIVVNFKANTINTGACTLNVNSLGAKAIKKKFNIDLEDGDIKAGQLVSVIYDGTNFQMFSPYNTATASSDFSVINDINSLANITIAAIASAVNNFKSSNAATGNAPLWEVEGTDTNIDFFVKGKGTGGFKPQNYVVAKFFNLTPGSAVSTNASLGNEARLTTDQSFTLSNPSNPTDGQKMAWRFKQGTGGSHVITLGSAFNEREFDVTLSTAVDSIDWLYAAYNSTAAEWEVLGFSTEA